MDLHGVFKRGHIILGQSGVGIVLLHMGSAVLVKIKVLAVTAVVQALEGQENIRDHGVDLVPPQRNDCGGYARLDARFVGQQTS